MPLRLSAFSNAQPQVICEQPAGENVLPNLSTTAVAPGSWAYVHVASPTKKPIVKVAVDVKEAQATKRDYRK